MVSASVLSLALSTGLFAVGGSAGPIKAESFLPGGTTFTASDVVPEGMVSLKPLRERDYFPHHQKRSEDLSSFKPKSEIRMIFGSGAAHEADIHVAELKIRQPSPEHPLILLEDLEHHAGSISCQNDKLHVEFNNKPAMEAAIREWHWVNKEAHSYFYIVTHHEHKGCGPDEQRAPYKVSNVEFQPGKLSAVLTREAVTWQEAGKNFDLKIGSVEHPAPHGDQKMLMARESRKSGSHKYKWVVEKDFTLIGKEFTHGTIGLYCAECELSGNMGVEAWASGGNATTGTNFGIKMTPGIEKLLLQLKAEIKTGWQKVKTPELIKIPLVPAGVGIPGFGNLGLELVITPGFTIAANARGVAVASFTMKTGTAALIGEYSDKHTGFRKEKWDDVKKDFKIDSAEVYVDGTMDAYLKFGVRGGLSLAQGTNNLGVFVGLEASAKNNIKAGYKYGGFCPNNPKIWGASVKTSLVIEGGAEFEYDPVPKPVAFLFGGIFPDMPKTKAVIYDKPIFPGDKCWAFDGRLPGLQAGDNAGKVAASRTGPIVQFVSKNGEVSYKISVDTKPPSGLARTGTVEDLKKNWRNQPLKVVYPATQEPVEFFVCSTNLDEDRDGFYFIKKFMGTCTPDLKDPKAKKGKKGDKKN
ncbi:hypothetical protein TWF694_006880 [Orbilia ellipsospora]|uniref:DUF7029 domain-containing protein n=1 Tax=Orbilia ellipsospora TaxID=2528407 RepID=A0AAV9XLG2_9PEZI